MDPAPLRELPPSSSLSTSLLSFLDAKLSTKEDLAGAPNLLSELRTECNGLEQSLSDLNKQLQKCLIDYASHSDQLKALFSHVNSQLVDLRASTQSLPSSSSDGESGGVLGEELPALAKEVARVETVRTYAETALRLDTLVGDVEDAVSFTVNRTLKRHPSTNNSEEMLVLAIRTLKTTEDVLASVTKTHPQWTRLVSAVDHRVDRALAILRPQAIADHRALLARLGWPRPLSTLSASRPDDKNSADVSNPLLTMQGDLKHRYCESFLALCSLQELQRRRKFRQLEGHNREIALWQPLWAIEELVNPLSVASQHHFTKWIDKPEFIFALVYKIIRDYVDSMDELLQPLIDEAMLSGYSCREEWISGMVTSLSTYLAKEIFPKYIGQLDEESLSGVKSQARISWLHLVDLMMAFDKRIQSLIAQSGLLLSLQEDGNLQKISSLSVFCDRPDWLELWAEIELQDIHDKLHSEMQDEKSWSIKIQGAALLSGQEDHKAPTICSAFLRHISSLIDRCRLVPTITLRSRFVRLTCAPIIQKFLDCLLLRCQEAEGLTALTDDDGLTKVAKSINAAHYFESVLKEWCEDVFFLEMGLDQVTHAESANGESISARGLPEAPGSGIFDEELRMLEQFRTEWAQKLSTVVLRGFDANCREYIKNRKQWQEKGEELGVSRSFIGALDYLQAKMLVLEEALNRMDFTGVWRSLASGVDGIILHGILLASTKFSDGGVQRLGNDLGVLFGMFNAWCLRPEGFFPRVSEGLKLLRVEKRRLQNGLAGGERWLKENGMRHLSRADAEKISKNRIS